MNGDSVQKSPRLTSQLKHRKNSNLICIDLIYIWIIETDSVHIVLVLRKGCKKVEDVTNYIISQRSVCKSITLHKDGQGHFFAMLKRGKLFGKKEQISLSFDQFEFLKTKLQLKRMKKKKLKKLL